MLTVHILTPLGQLTLGLQRALSQMQGVTWHSDTESWAHLSPEMGAAVAVVDLVAMGVTHACNAIRELRRRWTLVPIVGYADFTPVSVHAVAEAAKAGMGAVALEGINTHPLAFRRAFDQSIAGTVSRAIEPELEALSDPTVSAYVRGCFLNPLEPVNVNEVSRAAHLAPRSVTRALNRSVLPGPEYFLSTARLLLAMRLLEDPDRSVRSVAEVMQYSDPNVLRRLLRSRLGEGYVRSRDATAFHEQVDVVRRLLQAAKHPKARSLSAGSIQ